MDEMRPLRSLVSFEEARRVILEAARPIEETEAVPLLEAGGRVLARDVVAEIDVPGFDRAAMDGYAVRAADTFGAGRFAPAKLRRAGVVHAGEVPARAVQAGECLEIATGAVLPEGADGVVKVEDTEREGDEVSVLAPIHPGEHVSRKGEDIRAGATILRRGDVLTPAKVGAAAALGRPALDVFRRPRVAVISSGDEIVELGQPLGAGRIYNVNSYALAAILQENGCAATLAPVAGDSRESVRESLEAQAAADLVVFSAGSSVGARDVLIDVLEEYGEVVVHGIALKPGKPTLFARLTRGSLRDRLVIGMPGYPTSCLSNAYMLLVPMVRRMASLPPRVQRTVEVPLARRIVSTTGRHQFFTVVLRGGLAHPAFKESGAITSMSQADGWIEIPANVDLVEKGENVRVMLFE